MTILCGIYQIKNIINNKSYIGQSTDINKRIAKHKTSLRQNKHDNLYLQNAYNKYGEDNFVFNILCKCDFNELDDKEIFYIKQYDSYNNGYNLTQGGDYNPNFNKYGKDNPSTKYTLWDTSKCSYQTIKNKDMNKLWKCFKFRYKDYSPKIGCMFHDFYTPQLIHKLVVEAIGKEEFLKTRNTVCVQYYTQKEKKYKRRQQKQQELQKIGINHFIQLAQNGWTKQRILKEYCIDNNIFNDFLLKNNYTWKTLKPKKKKVNNKKKKRKTGILYEYNKQKNRKKAVLKRAKAMTTSGVLYVYYDNSKQLWVYQQRKQNKRIRLYSKNIEQLYQKVLTRNLEWQIIDKKKYKEIQQKVSIDNQIYKNNKYNSFQKIEENNLLFNIINGIKKGYNQSQVLTLLSEQYFVPYSHFKMYLLYKNISWDNLYYYAHMSKIKEHEQEIILFFTQGYTQKYIRDKFHLHQKFFTSFCQDNQYKTHTFKQRNKRYNNRIKSNQTGYYRVDKQPGKRYKYGFTYRYSWKEDGKVKTLKSTDIQKLEKKVKDRGLKWQKVPIQT